MNEKDFLAKAVKRLLPQFIVLTLTLLSNAAGADLMQSGAQGLHIISEMPPLTLQDLAYIDDFNKDFLVGLLGTSNDKSETLNDGDTNIAPLFASLEREIEAIFQDKLHSKITETNNHIILDEKRFDAPLIQIKPSLFGDAQRSETVDDQKTDMLHALASETDIKKALAGYYRKPKHVITASDAQQSRQKENVNAVQKTTAEEQPEDAFDPADTLEIKLTTVGQEDTASLAYLYKEFVALVTGEEAQDDFEVSFEVKMKEQDRGYHTAAVVDDYDLDEEVYYAMSTLNHDMSSDAFTDMLASGIYLLDNFKLNTGVFKAIKKYRPQRNWTIQLAAGFAFFGIAVFATLREQ